MVGSGRLSPSLEPGCHGSRRAAGARALSSSARTAASAWARAIGTAVTAGILFDRSGLCHPPAKATRLGRRFFDPPRNRFEQEAIASSACPTKARADGVRSVALDRTGLGEIRQHVCQRRSVRRRDDIVSSRGRREASSAWSVTSAACRTRSAWGQGSSGRRCRAGSAVSTGTVCANQRVCQHRNSIRR